MHKAWILLCLLVMATSVRGAEWPDMDHLDWDDPVWYSGDGQTWYRANFLFEHTGPYCTNGGVDASGFPIPADCSKTKSHVGLIWYDKPQHPDGMQITHLRTAAAEPGEPDPVEPDPPVIPDPDPVDPEPPKTKCLVNPTTFSSPALRSPPDRLVNLITTGDSAFGTAQRIREDKAELMPRIDEIYRIISEVVKCEPGLPSE